MKLLLGHLRFELKSSHSMEKRISEFYKVLKVQTERFKKSAIPSMVTRRSI